MKIKKLTPFQYNSMMPLFQSETTNLAAIYGVIEGLMPGEIWVDREDLPSSCLLLCKDSYCFIAGKLNLDLFQEFLTLLKKKQSVRLKIAGNEDDLPFNLSDFGFTPIHRREYKYKENTPIPYYENHTKYLIKRIADEHIFDSCIWKNLILDIYGNTNNYLKNGMGFVLWDDDLQIVVSEAHGISSKNLVEIGTVTHENYRGQKLSTIICNHLIRHAVADGMQPAWGCNETNIPSWKVAEHQGMNTVTYYTFHMLNE